MLAAAMTKALFIMNEMK